MHAHGCAIEAACLCRVLCVLAGVAVELAAALLTGSIHASQHDLLWEQLTPTEHLSFYGRLKGLKVRTSKP